MEGAKRNPGAVALLVKFKEHLKFKHYAPSTISGTWDIVFKFLLWVEKTWDKPVRDITRDDILTYRNYLTDRGYAPATVKSHLHCVRLFFKWLVEQRYALVNPF